MNDDFEYHITFPATTTLHGADKEPVIVLFGWAGGADKNLAKYSKIYEKQGCTTIRFVTSAGIMSPRRENQKKIHDMAEKIVGLMQDMTFGEHPIFFHSFSNGGSVIYQHVNKILREQHSDEFQVKGCIFDSAPAKVSAIGFLRAAVAVTPGNVVWKYIVGIVVVVHTLFLDMCNSFFGIVMGGSSKKRVWNALMEEPNQCPQLFLFSKGDDICSWETIQEFADLRKQKGVNVSTVVWDDSPHVKHMMFHEEAYSCAVCTFVEENIREDVDTVT